MSQLDSKADIDEGSPDECRAVPDLWCVSRCVEVREKRGLPERGVLGEGHAACIGMQHKAEVRGGM